MYLLYSAVAALALLVTAPLWLIQMARRPKHRAGLAERLGRVPRRLRGDSRPAIWIHAVSVGELLAITAVAQELRVRHPQHRVVVSTTTATGQKLARERFGADSAFYFPLDFAFIVRRYLRALRPELVVVAETEFWPNFLRLARAADARVAVVNARISDRSFPRYRRFRGLMRTLLRNVDTLLAQSEEDRRRLVEIGAAEERVHVSGNLKFDLKPAAERPLVAALRSALQVEGLGPVLVAGSTVEAEEPLLLDAFAALRQSFPKMGMILAPRHPERFQQVAALLRGRKLAFLECSTWNIQNPQRPTWNRENSQTASAGVFLLDTLGDLAAAYALADIAFVGGSLAPRGGHNILEAAQHGAAIVVGPHTENFRDIMTRFQDANAIVTTAPGQLTQTLHVLFLDPERRRELGRRAAEVLRRNAGATARTLAALEILLGAPAPPPQAQSARSRQEA